MDRGLSNIVSERSDSAGEGAFGQARTRIAEAAALIMAEKGMASVSYRQVAARAGVSLALVNYHYPAKSDLIAAAAAQVLNHLREGFDAAAGRARTGAAWHFRDYAYRLVRNASCRDRIHTLAWAEIILDAVRHHESLAVARRWNSDIAKLWTGIAKATGDTDPQQTARSGIDLVTGLQFFTLALSLDEARLDAVLLDHGSPFDHWEPIPATAPPAPPPATKKAAATRERILGAAIDLLISEGPAGVGFRSVAERAGLTAAAPAYHFRTIEDLLSAAEMSLIGQSKDRYRTVMRNVDRSALSLDQLVDVTTTVFIREATEFAPVNLAFFGNWIEASRRPELRPTVWTFIRDIHAGWQKLFETVAGRPLPAEIGMIAFALFLGKLIRALSTGSDIADLSEVRGEFADDFSRLCAGNFWALSGRMG